VRTALVLSLAAGFAFAATRAKDTSGGQPSDTAANASQGVRLNDVVGCRMSIRVDGGGNIASGCKLVPWYKDEGAISTWAESDSTLWCTTTARLDGGQRSQFVCPDLTPAARYGWIAAQKVNCLGADGGTGAAELSDGGSGPLPVVRIECWGPNVTPN